MRFFLKNIVKSLLKLYPYSMHRNFNRYMDILFTHWIKCSFNSFGNNSYIERGLRLWNGKYISIGENVCIRRLSNLSAWDKYQGDTFYPEIQIGDNCSIGEFVNISCTNKIILGKNVLIGRWVTIIDHAHGSFSANILELSPSERGLYSKGSIVIEDNVWIADKVTICSNVRIHRGAIIGANSVVTKDVMSDTMVAGCPTKVIATLKQSLK